MDPWLRRVFGSIFLVVFCICIFALSIWLAAKLDGWKRWAGIALAIAAAIMIFWALQKVELPFTRPFRD